MGCPRGTRSVFMQAFWAKKTSLFFLGKKEIIITPQTWHNDLFFSLQSFSGKTQRKIGPTGGYEY